MNAQLIAAMAARRQKERTLHLHRVTIVPGGGEAEVIEESAETVRRWDRVVAWIGIFGLVGGLALLVAERIGGA